MQVFRASDLADRKEFFEVLGQSDQSQVASMIIAPAKNSGEYGTDHPNSDQVLIVLDGEAEVRIGEERVHLAKGDLCLIEAGEPHQVRNPGLIPLKTLNIYAPPAYENGRA
jgi:mannose-6-phosphate isomerase-like protein (cupin superfamily)